MASTDKDVNSMARIFHDQYAREFSQAYPQLAEYKRANHEIMGLLKNQLGMDLCQRMEFTGSAYEGTRIGPEVEFDVMLIRNGEDVTAQKDPANPGFVYLKDRHGQLIDPRKIMNDFKGAAQKALDKIPYKYQLKLCDHGGPALQMDVHHGGKLLFSTDLVPTFQIKDRFYVAKPLENRGTGKTLSLWRDSASPQEKICLFNADKDNGCRKQVFRICKAVCMKTQTLKPALQSYLLKNALLHENQARPNSADWSPRHVGERTLDVLKRISKALEKGCLTKFFVPEMHLMHKMEPSTRLNMSRHIDSLIRHPEKLFAIGDDRMARSKMPKKKHQQTTTKHQPQIAAGAAARHCMANSSKSFKTPARIPYVNQSKTRPLSHSVSQGQPKIKLPSSSGTNPTICGQTLSQNISLLFRNQAKPHAIPLLGGQSMSQITHIFGNAPSRTWPAVFGGNSAMPNIMNLPTTPMRTQPMASVFRFR